MKSIVIGDIHGCYSEFIRLLEKLGYIINNNKIINAPDNTECILVGDYIDKGYAVEETIDFIYDNLSFFKILIGNHENYVFKSLSGKLSDNSKDHLFDSLNILKNNESLKNKFFSIINSSVTYLTTNNAFITHAPCTQNDILNFNEKAFRTFRYPKLIDFNTKELFLAAIKVEFNKVFQDSNSNLPLHVFGHISVSSVETYNNKVAIDTGCVYGNYLSAIIIENGKIIDCVSEKSSCLINLDKVLPTLFYL